MSSNIFKAGTNNEAIIFIKFFGVNFFNAMCFHRIGAWELNV